jgi:hypothetical protein
MQAGSDPRVQGLVESLQLTGSGKTVALSFTVPAEVLQLIPKAHQPLASGPPLVEPQK